MTELKTLKDFEYKMGFEEVTELRAEAVKWVKKEHFTKPAPCQEWRTLPWIINFFNLTEEDLKGATE